MFYYYLLNLYQIFIFKVYTTGVKTKTLIPIFLIFCLIYWAVYIWNSPLNNQSNLLTVAFLDIGQGDSIFIQAPSSAQMLVDGGRTDQVLDRLHEVMPRGDNSIDLVLATHPDADHIGGLSYVLENYKVSEIIDNGTHDKTNKTIQRLNNDIQEEIKNSNAKYVHAVRGMKIILDSEKNIYFEIYYPTATSTSPDSNNMSIVGKLVYGENDFLLTGDSPKEIENTLMKWCIECLKSDVLKVGHHGSRNSTSREFLNAVQSEYAIISAGKNNSYGHPHREVMDLLEQAKTKILQTSEMGSIIFESDGKELKLR
jgi:competence protein ComEC